MHKLKIFNYEMRKYELFNKNENRDKVQINFKLLKSPFIFFQFHILKLIENDLSLHFKMFNVTVTCVSN